MKLNFVNVLKIAILLIVMILVTSACSSDEVEIVNSDNADTAVDCSSMRNALAYFEPPKSVFIFVTDYNFNIQDSNGAAICRGVYSYTVVTNELIFLSKDSVYCDILNRDIVGLGGELITRLMSLNIGNEKLDCVVWVPTIPYDINTTNVVKFRK